jgi:hypothetical protein
MANAREWFNAFDPVDPPDFAVKHPGWCRRHYAPAIRLDLDEAAAAAQLTTVVIALCRARAPELTGREVLAQLNGMAWCCIAEDARVRKIWTALT